MTGQGITQRIAMKAVIAHEGKVLLLREAATYGDGTNRGRYHLPGGRVEIGEPFLDALHREIQEETGLEVTVREPLYVGEWRPVIRGVPNQIIGVFFVCEPKTTDVRLSTEHDHYEWVSLEESKAFDAMGPEEDVLVAYFVKYDKA